jgi:hypothetical protein
MPEPQREDDPKEQPAAAPADTPQEQIAEMRAEITRLTSRIAKQDNVMFATVEALTADNEVLHAKLAERDAQRVWRALNSCDLGPYTYECVRLWCVRRLIIAEKRGGRWFVDEASLSARLARLAAFDH